MLGCSLPCSVVAASAEPRRAAVVLRLANLVVVNQPLPVRATGRRSSTSERSRLSRHHAASQADAARPNQAAVHLPPRHVLLSVERTVERVLLNAERTAERVLQLVHRVVPTVPLHVQATVLRHVHQKRAAVLLRVHRPVLRLADQRVQTAPHHVRQSVLLPVVQRVLTVPLHVHQHVVLSVAQAVLQLAVPKVPAAVTIVAVQTLAKSLS
jgi:hypothetical protein